MLPMTESDNTCVLPSLGNRCWFAGINLAPSENYDSGLALVNRERQLYRTDKLYTDSDILTTIAGVQPLEGLVVAMDLPKNMSMGSRFRQEAVRMHPLSSRRLYSPENSAELAAFDGTLERFAARTWGLYQAMTDAGALVVLFSQQQAKLGYKLFNPYRSRSPMGCRTMQALVGESLKLKGLSSNMAPSSVLDAMVGAYTAWMFWKGEAGEDYSVHQDSNERYRAEILRIRPEDEKPYQRRRFYRPRYR